MPRSGARDTLYAVGVTERYSLIAATAAQRLSLPPTFTPLARTRFYVDGRSNSAEAPEAHGIPIPRGSSRDQRPDLNQGMLDLLVEPQAGMPVRMQPLSGHRRDGHDFGQIIPDPMTQLPPHLWPDVPGRRQCPLACREPAQAC